MSRHCYIPGAPRLPVPTCWDIPWRNQQNPRMRTGAVVKVLDCEIISPDPAFAGRL